MSEPGVPPGTAWAALKNAAGSIKTPISLIELDELYRDEGILLHHDGIEESWLADFAQVLEAVRGFVQAFDWLRPELTAGRPTNATWPPGVWLEVGSPRSIAVPKMWAQDYGHTYSDDSTRGLWFDPSAASLFLQSTVLAQSPFEAAVHELGHITEKRVGAATAIRDCSNLVFADSSPGLSLSMYGAMQPNEWWAEATVAVNTSAWNRLLGEQTHARLRRFVECVNKSLAGPLI